MQHPTSIAFILGAVFLASAGFATTPEPVASVAAGVQRLFEQPLAPLLDVCDERGDTRIRRVTSATLDAAGRVEDRIELRTTTRGSASAVDYLINDVVMFTQQPGDEPQSTPAGLALVSDQSPPGIARASKLLTAFAAAHPRIFAADVNTPSHPCGAMRGKPEEQAKCGAIALFGGLSGNGLVCFASGGATLLCMYAIEKACENDPDSCQPGWTEG